MEILTPPRVARGLSDLGPHGPDEQRAFLGVVPNAISANPDNRSGRRLKLALVGADLAAIGLALTVAYQLRTILPGGNPSDGPSRHVVVSLLSLPIWAAVFAHYRLYQASRIGSRRQELGRLIHAVGTSVALMAALAFAAKLYVARGWLVIMLFVGLASLLAEREVVRRVLARQRRRGRLLRRVVIVGGNTDATDLAATLAADPSLGYEVIGFVDDRPPGTGIPSADRPVALGPIDKTLEVALMSGARGVIVVATAIGTAAANQLARQLTDAGLRVEVVPSLCDIAVERLTLRAVGRFPVLHVDRVRRGGWRAVAKRGFDVTVAGSGLLVTAPLLLVLAAAIKLTSPGPVLYRQKRVGRDGRHFHMLKLRTMVADAEAQLAGLRNNNDADGPLFKMRHDPRVTRLGRHLRRFSLDELPQLWNVLRGEMALVGPRPALPVEVTGWAPTLHHRLRVKPGITGMWQVNGRSDTSFEEYARLDLYYVDNWSLIVDLTILAKTIPAVFRSGAY
ncbi:MAG: sugar transferase [Actinobacteria bacterium]|nr:sugar transferase [Actinomycetota bacterium]